ncbi:hypothetical protein K439DRAFT_1517445 [Ramaria rubella]|nr:hypothetical protein K439DRAFT_1517445 [Ramaria rubella]
MPSPKRRKKTVTLSVPSLTSLEADLAVAKAKWVRARKKADVRRAGEKRSPGEASLSLSTSKPKKKKKKANKRDGEEDAGSEGEDGERTNSSSAVIVKWANLDFHYLTSTLINMISDNCVWRQGFNFDMSDSSEPINSGGKKPADHQREIAKLLLQDDASGRWTMADIKTLGNVIKNCIHALRKKYFEFRNELGTTGHGLIEEEREDEIWVDSAISNVWDKIQKSFPWYKELSCLLKASPIIDKEALANSATELDLSVLGCTSDVSDDDEVMVEGIPGSPHLDDPEPDEKITKAGCTITGMHMRQGSTTLPSQVNTKGQRGSFLDKAAELAASQNAAISAVIKKNNEARRERKQMDTDTAVQIKRMELDHELAMMERRMELEHQYEMARLQRPSSQGLQQGIHAGGSMSSSAMPGHNTSIPDLQSDFSLASDFFSASPFQAYSPR